MWAACVMGFGLLSLFMLILVELLLRLQALGLSRKFPSHQIAYLFEDCLSSTVPLCSKKSMLSTWLKKTCATGLGRWLGGGDGGIRIRDVASGQIYTSGNSGELIDSRNW
jgi:hypothetical protein